MPISYITKHIVGFNRIRINKRTFKCKMNKLTSKLIYSRIVRLKKYCQKKKRENNECSITKTFLRRNPLEILLKRPINHKLINF